MYKSIFNKREVFKFKRFGRKGYSLFACLGREVIIGTLSVATLSHARAEGIGVKPVTDDSISYQTDKEMILDEVSITGSRAPMAKSQAVRMVTVLERKDIQAAPVQSVNDLLKYAVGVDVRQRGPIGAQTDVSIRGGNYEQIAILLNGISICDPQTGHNAFDFPVDISEIERIEVLEGPSARVYGTPSLVGAINIVTRCNPKSSVSTHAESGSYGYGAAGARANIVTGHFNNQLSANYSHSDGYSRNSQGNLNADFEGIKAFYQGHYADDWAKVRWHAGISIKDFGSNTFYSSRFDNQFEHTLKTFMALQGENRHGALHIMPSIYWNRSMDRFELIRGDDAVNGSVPFNYHRSDVIGVGINSYFDWAAGRTAICADLRNEDLVSTTLGEPLASPKHVHNTNRDYLYGINRTNINLVLEHNIILNRFSMSAGITAVKNSWNNMNMRVYPGVDMGYRITNALKAYASYNTSLRMPSVTELYYSVGGHKADKYLKPEELTSVEGGLTYSTAAISAKANIYYNHWRNMIDWIRNLDDGSNATWQSVNFTKINAIGVQASVGIHFHHLITSQKVVRSLNLSYSYINQDKDISANLESKYSLEYLKHKVVGNLQLNPWRQLYVDLYYRWQDRTGSYTATDATIKAYTPYGIADARLSWKASDCNVYVEANNLFDKSYVDYGCVPQPGTWFIVGATWEL